MCEVNELAEDDAVKALKACRTRDTEQDHWEADQILCELLTGLGYVRVVKAFRKVKKWYS